MSVIIFAKTVTETRPSAIDDMNYVICTFKCIALSHFAIKQSKPMRKETKKESTSFVSNCFLSRSCIAVLSIREKHNKNRYKWWNFERAPVDLWKNNHYDTFFWPNNSDNELFTNCYSLPSKMKITVRKVLPGLLLYQLYEVSVFARHRMKKYRT